MRIAAHHPTLYIESSMGTGLGLWARSTGGVIRRYEGKGPLNIERRLDRTYGHLAADAEEYERGLFDAFDAREIETYGQGHRLDTGH